jgi:hypothetical protein
MSMMPPAAALARPGVRWDAAALLAILALACLPGLTSLPPLDVEAASALVALARLEDGAAVPPFHAAQALLVRGLEALHLARRSGIGAFRLFSALGVGVAVLACWWLGTRLVGRRAAWLGSALLAASGGAAAAARLATPDAAAFAGGTVVLLLLALAMRRALSRAEAAIFWLALGGGTVLGGPVVAVAALCMGVLAGGRLPGLRPLAGLPLVLPAIVLLSPPAMPGWGMAPLAALPLLGCPGLALAVLAWPAAWQAAAHRGLPLAALAALLAAAALGAAPLAALPPLLLAGARWALDPARRPPRRGALLLAAACFVAPPLALAIGAVAAAWIDLRVLVFAVAAVVVAAVLVTAPMAAARRGAWARAGLLAALLALPLHALLLAGTAAQLPIARVAQRISGFAGDVAPGLPPAQFGVAGPGGAALRFVHGRATRILADGAEAAAFLAAGPGRMVAVADAEEAAFHRAAQRLGLALREEAMVLVLDPLGGGDIAMLFFRAAR